MSQAPRSIFSENLPSKSIVDDLGITSETAILTILEQFDKSCVLDEVLKVSNLLSEKYFHQIFLEDIGEKAFESIFPRLSSAFDDVLSRLPGGEAVESSLTSASITKELQNALKIIQCIENLIRQIIAIISNETSGIALKNIPTLPDVTIDVLMKSYGHCKNSENVYGSFFKYASNSLGILFQKTYNLQKSFGFVLSKIEMPNEDDRLKETQITAVAICDGLLGICQVISGMDNMLLGATWKLLLGFMSEFNVLLLKKLTIKPYISMLCNHAQECLKYTNQLSTHSSHLLSSGETSTQKAFARSCKFSLFFMSSLSTVIKLYGRTLHQDVYEVLTNFLQDIFDSLKLSQANRKDSKVMSSMETQYDSEVNNEIESIVFALITEDSYIEYFTDPEIKTGSISLLLVITKLLVADGNEDIIIKWLNDEASTTEKFPVIHLIELIIKKYQLDQRESSGMNYENLSDTIVIRLYSLISCLPLSTYSFAEQIIINSLFSNNPSLNILAMDVLVLICRFSTRLCDHYFTLFHQILESNTLSSSDLCIQFEVILKFLQRIIPYQSSEALKKLRDKDAWPASVLCPYTETLKSNFQFIFVNVCKEFSYDVNSWLEGKHKLSELYILITSCDKLLQWIPLVRMKTFGQLEKQNEMSQGEEIISTAILKLLKSSSELLQYADRFMIVSNFFSSILNLLDQLSFKIFQSEASWLLEFFANLLKPEKISVRIRIQIAKILKKFIMSTGIEDVLFILFSQLIADDDGGWRIPYYALNSFEILSSTSSGTSLLEKCTNYPVVVSRVESHLSFQALDHKQLCSIMHNKETLLDSSNLNKSYKSWLKYQWEKRKLSSSLLSKSCTNEPVLKIKSYGNKVLHELKELNKSLTSVDELLHESVTFNESMFKELSNSKVLFRSICNKFETHK